MTEAKEVRLSALALDVLHAVAQSQTADDLRAAAERFSAAYEFSYWIYGLAGPDKAVTNYPDHYVTEYAENRWHCSGDPLIDAIDRRHRALSWDLDSWPMTDRPVDAPQRRLMECRWELGARAGVSAPAYDRRGGSFEYALVSFSRDRPLSAVAQRHLEPHVQVFAGFFLSVAESIFLRPAAHTEPEPACLTERERDCLTWSASGKSSCEIGQILGITAATVNFHLGNAARKLGARGRVRAVAQAIRRGLIDPS